jgi:hypothetical protein
LSDTPQTPQAPREYGWCTAGQWSGRLHRPITEGWLREHEFKINAGRGLNAEWVRQIAIGGWTAQGRRPFDSPDDLCIAVAPTLGKKPLDADTQWHCWIVQEEPRRSIHVRHMRYTWELARLYEGLTGMVWPGTL